MHTTRVLLDPTEYKVIHNVSGVDEHSLECQFENSLERGYALVVVEPPGLGHNCIRWIRVGNFLHKSAVISAIGTLVITPLLPREVSFCTTFPLGAFSIGCATLYGLSWQHDPCCKYQVDYKGRELTKIPSNAIHSSSPVILVRRNDKYRKIVHNALALAVTGYLGYILYKHFVKS
jgi:hypothetical protein